MTSTSFASAPSLAKPYHQGKQSHVIELRDVSAGGLQSNVLDLGGFLLLRAGRGFGRWPATAPARDGAAILHAAIWRRFPVRPDDGHRLDALRDAGGGTSARPLGIPAPTQDTTGTSRSSLAGSWGWWSWPTMMRPATSPQRSPPVPLSSRIEAQPGITAAANKPAATAHPAGRVQRRATGQLCRRLRRLRPHDADPAQGQATADRRHGPHAGTRPGLARYLRAASDAIGLIKLPPGGPLGALQTVQGRRFAVLHGLPEPMPFSASRRARSPTRGCARYGAFGRARRTSSWRSAQ